MRPSNLLAPLLALAACSGPAAPAGPAAHVALDVLPGWTGTTEVMVHTPAGALVSRAPITADQDVAISDGDTVSVVLHDGHDVAVESDLDVSQGDTVEVVVAPLSAPPTANITVLLPDVPGATGWIVSGPDTAMVDSATAPVQIEVPSGTTSAPVLAEALEGSGTPSVYASAAAPISSFTIDLQTPADFSLTQIAPIGAGVPAAFASVFVGDDWLGVAATSDGYAIPTALGDKVELGATERNTTATRIAAASFDPAHVPATYAPDLSLPDLPSVAPITITGSTLAWTDDAGTGYDVVLGYLASSAAPAFWWEFSARPGSASATMPELPADLGAPASFDSAEVTAFERSGIDGYDAAIATDGTTRPGETWGEIDVSAVTSTRGPRAPIRGHSVSRR